MQQTDLLVDQNALAMLGDGLEEGWIDLVSGNEVGFTRPATKEVCRDRVTELQGRGRTLLAEENHVGKV